MVLKEYWNLWRLSFVFLFIYTGFITMTLICKFFIRDIDFKRNFLNYQRTCFPVKTRWTGNYVTFNWKGLIGFVLIRSLSGFTLHYLIVLRRSDSTSRLVAELVLLSSSTVCVPKIGFITYITNWPWIILRYSRISG